MATKVIGHDIERLKKEGRYRIAGSLAFILGHDNYYGCHYGMRSTLDFARDEFRSGWIIASRDYKESNDD